MSSSQWNHGLHHKPLYRLHWADPYFMCFRDQRGGDFALTSYLITRQRWREMSQGRWPA